MSKVEKLYNFIVDQMVDQTEIVSRNETRLHFMQNRMNMYGINQNDYFKAPSRFFLSKWVKWTPPKAITKYLRDVYGLSDEEVIPLFNLYKEKMGEIILEKYPKIMSSLRGKRRFNESTNGDSKLEKLLDAMSDSFINNHYKVVVDNYHNIFKLVFILSSGGRMVIYKNFIIRSAKEHIDWEEGYEEILNQDEIVDELPVGNSFDQTIIDYLHPFGIKKPTIYERFFEIFMDKLLVIVIKDTEHYKNKGYTQGFS